MAHKPDWKSVWLKNLLTCKWEKNLIIDFKKLVAIIETITGWNISWFFALELDQVEFDQDQGPVVLMHVSIAVFAVLVQ